MDSTITAADLTSILDRIGQRGERFVVERDGEPIAVLTPAPAPSTITLRDIATRLQNMAHTVLGHRLTKRMPYLVE